MTDSAQTNNSDQTNPAADVVRQKLAAIYGLEPSAKEELSEAKQTSQKHSKHQEFMYRLSTSGKSLADIQTAWHNYYVSLPDHEKHEVWREFYKAHGQANNYQADRPGPAAPDTVAKLPILDELPHRRHGRHSPRTRSVAEIKNQISHHASSRRRLSKKHHLQSLVFGLAAGSLVVLVLLFGFFNERFIAPLVTPSRSVNSTPIITDPNSAAASSSSEIIIPKINVEIPVVYDQTSIDEKAMQQSLENGVVHYATTPLPGELGNTVIFGHSSNNILNKGKYKFAFVLLSRLENGDLFYLDKDSKRYVYKVTDKRVVEPTDVSVLNKTDFPATATLITCDPPGTSLHRLVVIGQQVTPDPAGNKVSSVSDTGARPAILPSNSPSLWSRVVDWFLH